MSATDDLIALGCGAAVGKIFFWGLILSLTLVIMHPWILLLGLAIWWLIKQYGAEPITAMADGGSPPQDAATTLPSGGGVQRLDGTPVDTTTSVSRGTDTAGAIEPEPAGAKTLICMTWNLGRRSHPDQGDLVRRSGADIVALQEVSGPRIVSLGREFAAAGLVHQHGASTATRSFPFASMIASRWPIRDAAPEGLDVPFPERVQVAIVTTPFGDVEVLNVHVPAATSSGIAVKVATFEGIARYLSRPSAIPRIMVGDFNTPKSEAGGRTSYWGSAHQQGAERAVIEGHATTGLHDAFRRLNGAQADAASWRASNRTPRRYDHVFASPELVPIEATYGDLEQISADKMSDHAPLTVVFEPGKAVREQHRPQTPTASSTDANGTKPPSTPIPAQATPPQETDMPTTHDTDLNTFLASLTYRVDVRKPPDNRRRAQFRIGWNTQSISEKKLAAELSWNNLGYRAGKTFGPKSHHEIDAFFDRFAAIYDRGPVTVDRKRS